MSSVNKKSARERAIDRIKTTLLIKRLQKFVLAEPGDDNYEKVQLSQPQVNSIRILLGKKLPDMKAIEQTIRDERVKTREEIDAGLTALGLDPKEI